MEESNKKIVKSIGEIINNKDLSQTQKSDNIMKCLCNESIRIPLEYVNSFIYTHASLSSILKTPFILEKKDSISEETDNYIGCANKLLDKLEYYNLATLDSDKIIDENYQGDAITIWGNSFGPFSSKEYFKDDMLRIMWLLKESYIEKDSFISGDRGKHNQADEYIKYVNENGKLDNHTFDKLIKLTQKILLAMNQTQEDISFNEVMEHICILEVNHFPGLAFNSKKSNDVLIGKWAARNAMIIKTLIDFYKPNILIGGNTIGHFYNIPQCGIDSLKNSIENGNNELLSKLGINVSCVEQPIDSSSYVFKASLDCNNNPIYVIDAYHPNIYKNTEAEADSKLIKEWLTKENGLIKSPTE